MDDKTDSKNKSFMNNFSINMIKTKEEAHISLRKRKLESLINEKRMKVESSNDTSLEIDFNSLQVRDELKAIDFTNPDLTLRLKEILLQENHIDLIKFSIYHLRQNLREQTSKTGVAYIPLYINQGFIEILSSFLNTQKNKDLVVINEVLWCLINLTTVDISKQVHLFFSSEMIDNMCLIVDNVNNEDIIESVFWLYSNIIGSPNDTELKSCFMHTPLHKKNIKRCLNSKISFKTKLYSFNLVFGCVNGSKVGDWCYDIMEVYAANYLNTDCNSNIYKMIYGLVNISENGNEEYVRRIIDLGLHFILISHRIDYKPTTLHQLVRFFGNLSYSNITSDRGKSISQELFEGGIVELFEFIIEKYQDNLEQDSLSQLILWGICNMCTEKDENLHTKIIESSLFKFIIANGTNSNIKVVKEAVWCIYNLIAAADLEKTCMIIKEGGLKVLVNVLYTQKEPEILCMAIEAVKNVFTQGDDFSADNFTNVNPFKIEFETHNGKEAIETLVNHPHNCVYKDSKNFLEKFYSLGIDNGEETDCRYNSHMEF